MPIEEYENKIPPIKNRLLCCDVGNTSIKISFIDGGIRKIWRILTLPHRSEDEYGLLMSLFLDRAQLQHPDGAVISSVVPELTDKLVRAVRGAFGIEPLNVSMELKTGLTFEVKNPYEIGNDRIVNASAAYRLYKGSLIVIDIGTATTFCAVSEHGGYLGGPIIPGPQMFASAMAEKTAKLPLISLNFTETVIGSSTAENMLAGIVIGQAGAVERIVFEIKNLLSSPVTTITTGGFAYLVEPLVSCIDTFRPTLTFEGLSLIYALNT